ncbi:hypothetical protein [Rhodopirellula europaea]|uniref:hypothetical protein n=1 Tax=Rhodopirellula europaea TaxID=1263866 RepID=UPI001F1BC323|nr:hypothetical protein [Rhodopirellula europaea]
MKTIPQRSYHSPSLACPDNDNQVDDRECLLLCVHDETRRAQYSGQLIAAGYLVTQSGDGVTCLEHLRTNKFAVLVIEINLPWGQGDGVIDVMFKDDAIETIPTVLLDFLQVSFSDDGQVGLSNPLSSEELVRVVHQRLAGGQG